MKFIKFPEANASVPMTTGDPMHYYTDGQGNLILCAEIDKEDLKFVRDHGRVFLLLQGFKNNTPPPCGVIAFNPFKLNLPTNGKEDKNKNSAGDDGKSHNGDSKLSIA